MKAIRKYKLSTEKTDTSLNLKWGYRFVHTEYVTVDKALYLWVEEPLSAEAQSVSVKIKVAKSGDPLPDSCRHIATAVDSFAPEAYHVFFDSSLEKQDSGKVHNLKDPRAA